MKKYGLAALATGGLAAAIVGLAAPAHANENGPTVDRGLDHRTQVEVLRPDVYLPHIDGTVFRAY